MAYILRRTGLGAGSCSGIAQACQNDVKVVLNPEEVTGLVFRWGCTATIPNESSVVNTVAAIHLVNDKLAFRKILQEKELCPRTIWEGCDWSLACPDRPVVVRPKVHAQGKNLYVAENDMELDDYIQLCGEGWYASILIDKVAEYRVCLVQGRVVWVVRKIPKSPEQVAWNMAQGGKVENVKWNDWPLRVVRVATEAFELSGLDFGGVDVVVDGDGNAYVLEINSAPSLKSPYRESCMARAFDWIIQYGKKPIKRIQEKGGYKKFIHPAVCGQALFG